MIAMQQIGNGYAAPELVEYGSIVLLTGACDGPCIDGVGGMNPID